MSTVTPNNVTHLPEASNCVSPWGNLTALNYNYTVNASGIFENSSLVSAVQSGDIVRLGILPAGLLMLDMIRIISNAFAGSTTDKIGFQYVDGVDVTAVPQDDDFFCGATASSSTAITRKTAVTAPVTLPKDAYLILTRGGAADSEAGVMDITILGIRNGAA